MIEQVVLRNLRSIFLIESVELTPVKYHHIVSLIAIDVVLADKTFQLEMP